MVRSAFFRGAPKRSTTIHNAPPVSSRILSEVCIFDGFAEKFIHNGM
jgi:hypothetical protein